MGEAEEVINDAIANAAHASCTSLHSTLKLSLGEIVFNQDMLLDIPVLVDLHALQDRHQQYINKNLERANQHWIAVIYQPGDQVLKLVYKLNKLEPRTVGPYTVKKTHCNGTLTIRINPLITQRINIRYLKPYRT